MNMVEKVIRINELSFPYTLAEYSSYAEMRDDLSEEKILQIVNMARNKRDKEHYYRVAQQEYYAVNVMSQCFNISIEEAYIKYKTMRGHRASY